MTTARTKAKSILVDGIKGIFERLLAVRRIGPHISQGYLDAKICGVDPIPESAMLARSEAAPALVLIEPPSSALDPSRRCSRILAFLGGLRRS